MVFLISHEIRILAVFLICVPTGADGEAGPTGPTGSVGASSFGGLYNDTDAMLTINPSIATIMPLSENMPSNNVSLGANGITIAEDGVYSIGCCFLARASTGSFDFSLHVTKNGTALPSLITGVPLGSEYIVFSISSSASLAAGDIISVVVVSIAGGTVQFGNGIAANLSVVSVQ